MRYSNRTLSLCDTRPGRQSFVGHLLFVGLVVLASFRAVAEMAPPTLLEPLQADDPDRILAEITRTLENSESARAVDLLVASAAALDYVGPETATFLYHAGQLRAGIDLAVYPPVAATDDPALVLMNLSHQIGMAVDPVVTGDADGFAALAEQLGAWHPQFPSGYSPGWEYRGASDARDELAGRYAATYVSGMRDLGRLLDNRDYRDAVTVVRARNFGERPIDRGEYEAALEFMRRVETKLGVAGYAQLAD